MTKDSAEGLLWAAQTRLRTHAPHNESEAMREKVDSAVGDIKRLNPVELNAMVLNHEQQIKDIAAHLLELKQYMEFKRREWVELTDDEIDKLACAMVKGNKSANWLCRAIEAKLKEKNT